MALALLGKPQPAHAVGGELGTGAEPVFVGRLLGSERYTDRELVDCLGLDGWGMYMFLRHEGVQVQTEGHYMVAGGRIKSRARTWRASNCQPRMIPRSTSLTAASSRKTVIAVVRCSVC